MSSLLKELTESAGDIRFGEAREVELQGLKGLNRMYQVLIRTSDEALPPTVCITPKQALLFGGYMLKTTLCHQLGIEYPLFSVGMGAGMAGPELAAAVSNAGACGVLGMGGLPAPYSRQQIQHMRTLTNKPFGVNIILPLLQVTPSLTSRRPTVVAPRYLSRWGRSRKLKPRLRLESTLSLPRGSRPAVM